MRATTLVAHPVISGRNLSQSTLVSGKQKLEGAKIILLVELECPFAEMLKSSLKAPKKILELGSIRGNAQKFGNRFRKYSPAPIRGRRQGGDV
jgi:hypothetical protein